MKPRFSSVKYSGVNTGNIITGLTIVNPAPANFTTRRLIDNNNIVIGLAQCLVGSMPTINLHSPVLVDK